jgi:hypothetical protein
LNITSHSWLENWVLKIAKYYFYQCSASLKNTTFFSIMILFLPANYTTQPQPLYLGIIQMPLQKAADFEDCSHNRWGTTRNCCTDEAVGVCSALEIDNTYYNQELLWEVWFLN